MANDTLEDAGSVPDSGRAKRPPPTIDLEATDVSTESPKAEAGPPPEVEPEPQAATEAPETPPPGTPSSSTSISPWVIAPFSGAVAAALVIAVGWMLGWPQVSPTPAEPQVKAAAFDALASRVAGLEARANKPATDPATVARLDAAEKSLAALRSEVASLGAQSQKLATAENATKAAPGDASAAAADLAALNERIAKIEDVNRAQGAEIAQKAKPTDDLPLRRVVTAALLDVAVRHGDPYAATLSTAKSLASKADALAPLDAFATTGVPSPFALCRELLTLVPKLTPAAAETPTAGSGIVDRLQAGAAKLVHIERTDATGTDRSAIVARVTAAALHNELGDARRELETLSPADRAAAQGWLDKVKARDAALSASRQFADDTMAALAKPAQ